MNITTFKDIFEQLGYTFQSADVLEDVYLFYKYYDNEANKGVASILLEGDPGSGKTFLSEVFSSFIGKNTEYIYTQCVEETNSDRLIATYNVPAIVKGEADKALAAGILTRAITLANEGKKVVLTIDELDKAREVLDSYFLDFLQSGKIETSNNEILSLTDETRKNLFVIFAKNNERELSDPLLRRCSVIELPPMPPVLAYKTLLYKLENTDYDPKFLKFVSKVYESIYNEQMDNNMELLPRLPALQELIMAITGDYELYENGISSTRRIKNLIRKLGKDSETREVITNILVKKFKYQNKESNYDDSDTNLDFNLDNPDDYMSIKDKESLIEQYIEKKDSGEYIFEENDDDDLKEIATILDNIKDDESLFFLQRENKEKIVELGTITHKNPKVLDILFSKIKFQGNPNSKFGFLDFEGENFIGLIKYKNTLIMVANKDYVSPKLFIRGLSKIIKIIYDEKENPPYDDNLYFSPLSASDFKLTSLNAKILSKTPRTVLNKMQPNNGMLTYDTSNLKIDYDNNMDFNYFRYRQKFRAEPLYKVIKELCEFNPELALPASFISAKKFDVTEDIELIKEASDLKQVKWDYEEEEKDGWKVIIDNFDTIQLFPSKDIEATRVEELEEQKGYIFQPTVKEDQENKTIHIYPKYKLENGFLLYTSQEDFENNEIIKQLPPFQKSIAFLARDIFGNFVPEFHIGGLQEYFSALTMSITGRMIDNKDYYVTGIYDDITEEDKFEKYYASLTEPGISVQGEKVLKKDLNHE